MTDTIDPATTAAEAPKRRSLSALRLAELQTMASGMGIGGTAAMRKGDLITAIKERQGSGSSTSRTAAPAAPPTSAPAPAAQADTQASGSAPAQGARRSRRVRTEVVSPEENRSSGREAERQGGESAEPAAASPQHRESAPGEGGDSASSPAQERNARRRGDRFDRQSERSNTNETNERGDRQSERGETSERGDRQAERGDHQSERGDRGDRNDRRQQGDRQANQQGNRADGRSADRNDNRSDNRSDNRNADRQQGNRQQRDDQAEDDRGGRRRNRQRNRDRKRGRGRGDDFGPDMPEAVSEDDVLIPVAGILDVLDSYAFVRTSGYLPGPNDVYVPLGIVKRHGLRKGDAVTGAVKALADGEQPPARQKFNALVRLDTVNGASPDDAKNRVEFGKLTPLYPQQRLRLETEPNVLTTRIIDLVSPIGKGQRGLIVSPPKAGKTLILQAIANAIAKNNPEAHLMVVLVDERPEEVTDMQRTVKGEVIASTFDRPADDHTTVAELAIERAKRLVELGHDVVVLLDSITRLGRAYNLAAPASGRILSGGVDSSALYPPKRFFGAARNIENGGSLTILATALVETGSKMDEVIFEEFKGTGNMELRLSRQLADRRIFPAVDVNPSGTRREEILMSGEELKLMWKLRRVLSALDAQQGIELLLDRLKKTKSNAEFLMVVQKTSNIHLDDD